MAKAASTARVHAFPVYTELDKQSIGKNLRANLPKEVREQNSFLVFKFEPNKNNHAKLGKIPYYARIGIKRHGQHGKPEDLRELSTFTEAARAFEKGRYDGIGFATLGRVPLTFLDLDNCFDPSTGELTPLAEEIISWGSYTEFSVGGKGLRVVLSGNLKQNSKNLQIGLEIFCTRGFVTLTGIPFGAVRPVLEPDEEQIQRLRELVTFNERTPEGDSLNIPSPLTDERLKDVKKAIKFIDADCDYHTWVKVGQALHSGDGHADGPGFKLWLRWSSKGDKFGGTSEEDMARKWEGFHAGRGVTLASVFHIAKQHGYVGKKPKWAREEISRIEMGFENINEIEREELFPLAPGLFDNVGAYMLIGRSKVGKSRLMAPMLVGALTGGKFFDFSFNRPCRVLAMPLEERAQDTLDRLELYMVDPKDHADQLMFTDEKLLMKHAEKHSDDMNYIEYLDQVLGQAQPDLVYLDTWIKLKAVWGNEPVSNSKRATEQDYQMSSQLQELALKHHCVILFSIHGSKRKGLNHGPYDIFDSIGTTSWAMAGCAGALVMSDLPNFNALDESSDSTDANRRILSIRGRFRATGDAHLLLESRPSGIFVCLGDYRDTLATGRQGEVMQKLADLQATGAEWVTGAELAEACNVSRRAIVGLVGRVMADGGVWQGRKLVSAHKRGYSLRDPNSSE